MTDAMFETGMTSLSAVMRLDHPPVSSCCARRADVSAAHILEAPVLAAPVLAAPVPETTVVAHRGRTRRDPSNWHPADRYLKETHLKNGRARKRLAKAPDPAVDRHT